MALSTSIAVSQSGQAAGIVNLTDNTTGSEPTVVKRRIYFTDQAGQPVVVSGTTTTYEEWNGFPATTTKQLNLLTEDTAVHLRVDYLTSGNSVVTSFEDDFALVGYNKQDFYDLWHDISVSPLILQDANYVSNLAKFWVTIHGAEQCVQQASDLSASQNAMNIGTNMRLNETFYF